MKLAYADRDKYYGDPSFVTVPIRQLLSDEYTKIRYPLIDMNHASQQIRPGDPVNMLAYSGPGQYWPGEKGTTTCVVADKWGNVVAATPSANPDYGICESLGIAHNTRLSSLNTQKGHPNSLEAGQTSAHNAYTDNSAERRQSISGNECGRRRYAGPGFTAAVP